MVIQKNEKLGDLHVINKAYIQFLSNEIKEDQLEIVKIITNTHLKDKN